MIMTPWEDLFFVINNLLLGEEPVSWQSIKLSIKFLQLFYNLHVLDMVVC